MPNEEKIYDTHCHIFTAWDIIWELGTHFINAITKFIFGIKEEDIERKEVDIFRRIISIITVFTSLFRDPDCMYRTFISLYTGDKKKKNKNIVIVPLMMDISFTLIFSDVKNLKEKSIIYKEFDNCKGKLIRLMKELKYRENGKNQDDIIEEFKFVADMVSKEMKEQIDIIKGDANKIVSKQRSLDNTNDCIDKIDGMINEVINAEVVEVDYLIECCKKIIDLIDEIMTEDNLITNRLKLVLNEFKQETESIIYSISKNNIKDKVNEIRTFYNETLLRYKKFIKDEVEETKKSIDRKLFPDSFGGQIRYLKELKEKYSDFIYPFFAVDPRRVKKNKNFMKILKANVDKKSFFGIKIYPPFHYLPSDTRLKKVYDFCDENKIPITAHCGLGGIPTLDMFLVGGILFNSEFNFNGYLAKDIVEYYDLKFNQLGRPYDITLGSNIFSYYKIDEIISWKKLRENGNDELKKTDAHKDIFTNPLNWIPVFINPKDNKPKRECLVVNLAHFGDVKGFKKLNSATSGERENEWDPTDKYNWTEVIIYLMSLAEDTIGGRVYSDLALQSHCEDKKGRIAANSIYEILDSQTINTSFGYVDVTKVQNRLMYGSDFWPLGFVEHPGDYLKEYKNDLSAFSGIFKKNPEEFLNVDNTQWQSID